MNLKLHIMACALLLGICGCSSADLAARPKLAVMPKPAEYALMRESAGEENAFWISRPLPTHKNDKQEVSEKTIRSVELSIGQAIEYALDGNYEIRIAALGPAREDAQFKIARSVYDPQFFASTTLERSRESSSYYSTSASTTHERANTHQVGIKQHLPTGGDLRIAGEMEETVTDSDTTSKTLRPIIEWTQPLLNGRGDRENRTAIFVAGLEKEIARETFRKEATQSISELIDGYWELLYDQTVLQIARTTLEMAEEVHRRELVRKKQGVGNDVDTARAETAVRTRRRAVLRLERQVRLAEDQLKLTMNAKSLPVGQEQPIVLTDRPVVTLLAIEESKLIREAFSRRPEISIALKQIRQQKEECSLARHSMAPTLDLTVTYQAEGTDSSERGAIHLIDDRQPETMSAGLEFSYILGNHAAKENVRVQSAALKEQELSYASICDQICNEVRVQIHAVHLAEEEIGETEKTRASALRVLEGEKAQFELGQKSNDDLLAAQDTLEEAERTYAQAVIEYNMALKDLSKACGRLLDDNGIFLEK